MAESDIKKWHWAITWDNPFLADSSSMLAALSKLGVLTAVQTKTTYILSPKKNVTWHQIRTALVANLHPQKGTWSTSISDLERSSSGGATRVTYGEA